MYEPLFQGKGVDKGFERGARGSSGRGDIDLPVNILVEEGRGTGKGQNVTGWPVHEKGSRIAAPKGRKTHGKGSKLFFQKLLQGKIEGCADLPGKSALQKLACKMHGLERQISCCVDPEGGICKRHAYLKVVAPGILFLQPCRSSKEMGILGRGASADRVLRDRHEGEDFRKGKLSWILVEVDARSCCKALHIAPVGSEGKVGLKNVLFVVVPLKTQGQGHLAQLVHEGASAQVVLKADHLHGQGRASEGAAASKHGEACAHKGEEVHTWMVPEIPVLVVQHSINSFSRQHLEACAKAKATVTGKAHAQKSPVPVQDAG